MTATGQAMVQVDRLPFGKLEIATLCTTAHGRQCLKRGLSDMIERLAQINAGVQYHRNWLLSKSAVWLDEEDRIAFQRCQVQPLLDEQKEIVLLIQALGVALTEKLAHQRSVEMSFSSQHIAASSSFMGEWKQKQQELAALHSVVTRMFQKQ